MFAADLFPSTCSQCGSRERLVRHGLSAACIRCSVKLLDTHISCCRLGCDSDAARCTWATEFRALLLSVREGS